MIITSFYIALVYKKTLMALYNKKLIKIDLKTNTITVDKYRKQIHF